MQSETNITVVFLSASYIAQCIINASNFAVMTVPPVAANCTELAWNLHLLIVIVFPTA